VQLPAKLCVPLSCNVALVECARQLNRVTHPFALPLAISSQSIRLRFPDSRSATAFRDDFAYGNRLNGLLVQNLVFGLCSPSIYAGFSYGFRTVGSGFSNVQQR